MIKHAFFERASSWATDDRAAERRSRRTAWLIAGCAIGIAAFEAVALAMMAPLKTVQPVAVLVDRQTGFVETLDPEAPKRISADDALTQSLLAQYVTAREGFDRASISADYRKVGLWSTGAARQTYLSEMQPANPAGPLGRYPPGTTVNVRVKSVSRIAPNLALVRFATSLEDQTGRKGPEAAYITTVRYRFVDATMSFEDRLTNPLGFQIVGYRRESEAPEPTAPTTQQPMIAVSAVAGLPRPGATQ